MDLTQALAALAAANEANGALKTKLDAANATAKDLEMKLTASESETAAALKTAEVAKADAAAATAAHKDAADKFDAAVTERVAVVAAADKHLRADGKPVDISKMSNREVKIAVVKSLEGRDIDVKRSDDAVNYAFDLAVERASKTDASMETFHNANKGSGTSPKTDEAKAAAQASADLSNAYKRESK